MSTLVGAEYLIGNALLAQGDRKKITFDELKQYEIHVKEYCLKNDIDVILFLSSSNIEKAIYDFSDYFEIFFDDDGRKCISAKDNIDNESLEEQFLSALPSSVLIALVETALKMVA